MEPRLVKLLIFLPKPPECWKYKREPPFSAYSIILIMYYLCIECVPRHEDTRRPISYDPHMKVTVCDSPGFPVELHLPSFIN